MAEALEQHRGPFTPRGLDVAGMRRWKETAPLPWIAQPMAGSGRRSAANAQPWPLLILDVDGVYPLDSDAKPIALLLSLVSALRELAPCFGWFTASSTNERPRARMILLLSRPVIAAEAKDLARVLARDLSQALGVNVGSHADAEVIIDPSMQDSAHIAFSPQEGCRMIGLRDAATPLDVDDMLKRQVEVAGTRELVFPARPHTPEAQAEVASALNRLPPSAVNDRATWIRVLASLKSYGWPEDVMGPIARAWSERSSRFDPDRWATDWMSLCPEGGITPATLYHLAGQADQDCPAFGTDDGFACRFEGALAGRAMFARGKFFWWTGAFWQPDGGKVAAELKRHAREQADEAARTFHADPTDTAKERRAKAARLLLQQNVQDRVLRAVCIMLRVDEALLDKDPMLLACTNGTVDLRTGALKSADPDDRITLCTGHAYDPAATCPRWRAFLAEALADPETVDWCQRWFGYCATGDNREELMVLAIGPGGTGKSTVIKAIMHAFGGEASSTSYATAAASQLLSDTGRRRSANEHTGGLTPLAGKRLAAVNEVKKGEAWDDSVFKQLVSREPIQMREVGGAHAFSVIPTWKIVVRGNHRPNTRDVGDAFYRRVAVLEFKHKPRSIDRTLDDALIAEAPGILAWIVLGGVAWHVKGLEQPGAMREARDSYRAQQDVFGEWVASRIEPGGFTSGEELRHDYLGFSGQTRHPLTPKSFAAAMQERGYECVKYRGTRGFNVVLNPEGCETG
ncbi:hypothetical protein CSC65_08475 [Pseudoxanthomonas daejeonensis]|uniref:SF3 helicase domain-containing protein n=1 Tax=Pseudoxanthomonas daejeonensis TaxID=266062 RepID=A0ABQ6Z775_9GAMM|nr:hypothetical protein CSC65_08475 [Pseudoxanthomonas daejeonensis]